MVDNCFHVTYYVANVYHIVLDSSSFVVSIPDIKDFIVFHEQLYIEDN